MANIINFFKEDPLFLVVILLAIAIVVVLILTMKKNKINDQAEMTIEKNQQMNRLDLILDDSNACEPHVSSSKPLAPVASTSIPDQPESAYQSDQLQSDQVQSDQLQSDQLQSNQFQAKNVVDPLSRLSNFEDSQKKFSDKNIIKPSTDSGPNENLEVSGQLATSGQSGTSGQSDTSGQPDTSGVLTQYKAGDGQGIAEVENMLEKDPENLELLDWLAFMYYSNNKLENALDAYQRALNLDPENVNQMYYLGSTYFKLGNAEQACEYWQKVTSLKPGSKIARKAQEKIDKSS